MLRQGRNYRGDGDMINNINLFSTYSTLDTPIEIAIAKQGAFIYASAKGTVQLRSNLNKSITLEMSWKRFTPKCTVRLEAPGCRLNS